MQFGSVLAAALLLIGYAAAAPAQPQPRPLAVPSDKGWGHAATGLALPAALAGLPRTELNDNSASELDVVAHYRNADRSTIVTIYLFKPAVGGAALWFDRARASLLSNAQLGGTSGDVPGRAVTLPGEAGSRGFRASFAFDGAYKSSGVALISLGPWLLKVRATSSAHDAAALDALLDDVISGIRWPAAMPPAPAEPLVAACSDTVAYKRAKQVAPDMGQTLMSSIFGIGTLRGSAQRSANYCRNGPGQPNFAVYRADAGRDGYLLALGDSGRVVEVGKAPSLAGKGRATYAVSLIDLDRVLVYPSFDRLPRPEQVWTLVTTGSPVSSSSTGGETRISANAVRR